MTRCAKYHLPSEIWRANTLENATNRVPAMIRKPRNRGFNIASHIVERFGGRPKMTAATPWTYDQIRRMEERGYLTEAERKCILQCALAAGVDITPNTFIQHLLSVK